MADRVRTRAELISELGGRRAFDRAVDLGDVVRVFRGTYVPGDLPVDGEVKAEAAQLLLPKNAYLADRSLLWLWDIDVLPPGVPVVEAVVPRGAVVPQRAGFRVRAAMLPERDRFRWNEVKCLRPTRAVADLLCRLPLADALATCDACLRVNLCSRVDLLEEMPHHAGLRGVRQALRVLDLTDPRAESPPESKVRLELVLAGLSPVPQVDVFDGWRWIARVDLAFPELKIAIEYDGLAVHSQGSAFVRDRQRQNDLVRAGWIVLRFTSKDLGTGQIVRAVLGAMRLHAA